MSLITEPLTKAEVVLIQIADKLYKEEMAKLETGRQGVLQSIYDSHGILPETQVQISESAPGSYVLCYDRSEPSTGKDESVDVETAAEAQAPKRRRLK